MRKSPNFHTRICEKCNCSYPPSAPSSKYCKSCSAIESKERKIRWYRARNPEVFFIHGPKNDCKVCGGPFYSNYSGIPCCQTHYNVAYRVGDPFADSSRKTTNKFRDVDDYIIGTTASGTEYLFDKADFDSISKYSWCLSKTGYLVADVSYHVVKLHRYILGIIAKDVVDHINGDPLDNRRANLRITTPINNSRNSSLNKPNIVGVLGISKTPKGKYRARIMVNREEIRLGNFIDIESAIKAREVAEIKYFGEYAPALSRRKIK